MVVPDVSDLVSITENECGLRKTGEVVCWGNIVRPATPPNNPHPPLIRWNE